LRGRGNARSGSRRMAFSLPTSMLSCWRGLGTVFLEVSIDGNRLPELWPDAAHPRWAGQPALPLSCLPSRISGLRARLRSDPVFTNLGFGAGGTFFAGGQRPAHRCRPRRIAASRAPFQVGTAQLGRRQRSADPGCRTSTRHRAEACQAIEQSRMGHGDFCGIYCRQSCLSTDQSAGASAAATAPERNPRAGSRRCRLACAVGTTLELCHS